MNNINSIVKAIFYIWAIFLPSLCYSQTKIQFNSNWKFIKDSLNSDRNLFDRAQNYQTVSLPHTWNVYDVMDDEPGYYRGIGWYKKQLKLKRGWQKKELFLYFEGANQQTEVFVNGKKAGEHIGGYTAFKVPISKYLNFRQPEDNEILVKVDNSYNKNVPPLTADFTFFGGLYRNVSLFINNRVYFSGEENGASDVFISTPKVSVATADVIIKGSIANSTAEQQNLLIESNIFDKNKKLIATSVKNLKVEPGSKESFIQERIAIKSPMLWSPERPYLYKVQTKIIDKGSKEVLDELYNPLGFRFFNFDKDKGFFLNGESLKLIGASRHQDFQEMGNAVPDTLQVKDLSKLKEMGANFLRVAHYPQSQAILNVCDSLGLLVSVEIPIVNEITESDAFYSASLQMQKEMIWQNYNHPSVIIWAYMNEVLLRPHFENDKVRQQIYFENIRKLAQKLENLTRAEDSTRYTMMANHGNVKAYVQTGLTTIPMLVGWNLYQGWYGGKIEDFGSQLDEIHRLIPEKPLLVTEYGADADPRIHSDEPLRFDKSIEYAIKYHIGYIDDILKRPFVAGAAVWNLSDFNSETREETMPHINNKGLLTLNRQTKNTYFLYKANFSKEPFVKIGLKENQQLIGYAQNIETATKKAVYIFSNATTVELFVNNRSLGSKVPKLSTTVWDVPLNNGLNSIKAISFLDGDIITDSVTIDFKLIPQSLKEYSTFTDLNISLGDKRYYTDSLGQVWIPDQQYVKGAWGYIGGQPFKMEKNNRQPYGSDKNVKGTWNDPIYQTQQSGIVQYKLDVPNGNYKVVMHFAELTGATATNLIYNLDAEAKSEAQHQRQFSVTLNDETVINEINIAEDYGVLEAVKKTFETEAVNGKGIVISFVAKKGESVLNALQLKRVPVFNFSQW